MGIKLKMVLGTDNGNFLEVWICHTFVSLRPKNVGNPANVCQIKEKEDKAS